MFLALTACAVLLGAPAEQGSDSFVGTVRLTKGTGGQEVWIVDGQQSVRVDGELAVELKQLQAAKVEVLGTREEKRMLVKEYRILDIGKGVKPIVGELTESASGFALRDGDGPPIPLNLSPRAQEQLRDQAGAKLWVHGSKLISGELKVLRYGVLRPAPVKLPPPAPPKP